MVIQSDGEITPEYATSSIMAVDGSSFLEENKKKDNKD